MTPCKWPYVPLHAISSLILTVIDCGCLQIGNGSVTVDSTTVNSVATYHCNTGYDLVGTETRTCMASGMWSGIKPTCSKGVHKHNILLFSLLNLSFTQAMILVGV